MSQAYDFMKDRLDDQINYYSKQSAKNKKKYLATQKIIIILGVIIPIVNFIPIVLGHGFAYKLLGIQDVFPYFLLISSIISSIIGFTAALSQLNKYYEVWLNYRSTLELLKREKSLYQNSAGGYFNLSEVDKKRVFVDRVEELLSSEHTKFFSSFQQQMDSIQYVIDILNKVNELKSIDVTDKSKSVNKGELTTATTTPAETTPAEATPAETTTTANKDKDKLD